MTIRHIKDVVHRVGSFCTYFSERGPTMSSSAQNGILRKN